MNFCIVSFLSNFWKSQRNYTNYSSLLIPTSEQCYQIFSTISLILFQILEKDGMGGLM